MDLIMDKMTIGKNAGVLWRLMDEKRDKRVWNLQELQEASALPLPDFYAALGWLARENKIDFGENGATHEGTVGTVVEFYH